MPKLAPAPEVTRETWLELLSAAKDFLALTPWEFMYDTNAVGLINPVTGETRIACVLGNAGEVFAAVFYRLGGLRWMLSMVSEDLNPETLASAEGVDFVKLEFVPRNELLKEDKALLKQADFKLAGRGPQWPQFRSAEPGWHPWPLTQTEADQLLSDLPRLTTFCRMLEEHPDLFENRGATEVAFLPAKLPDRRLKPDDIDWQPLVPPPIAELEAFRPTVEQSQALRALKQNREMECEFDCMMLPGASFIENGRPCFGRAALLVETRRGLVLGARVISGTIGPGEAAGKGLIEALLGAGSIPKRIFIGGSRFEPVLQPLCGELGIELLPVSSLPALEEALDSLSEFLLSGKAEF